MTLADSTTQNALVLTGTETQASSESAAVVNSIRKSGSALTVEKLFHSFSVDYWSVLIAIEFRCMYVVYC